jgi:UDP-glucuronate decarboxylase
MTAQKRALVTGGAGFIGSHLCDRLIAIGRSVVCVDNFCTGTRSNIAHLLGHSSFELLEHDVTTPLLADVDEIYNFACPASPAYYQLDPIQTTKASVLGALNMLELAKRLNVPILQASTSEVYGDPLIHPQTEGYWGNVNPLGPRSCYNEGKRCAETLFSDYRRQHGIVIKIARIFNTYGPRMRSDDGRVVSNFIVNALRRQPLRLYGGGRQTRSFCYVDDLVEAVILLMETPGNVTGPVNLGDANECSIRDLGELVLEISGCDPGFEAVALPQDDPTRRLPDISLARDLLGWNPTVPLRDGLQRTLVYFEGAIGGVPGS